MVNNNQDLINALNLPETNRKTTIKINNSLDLTQNKGLIIKNNNVSVIGNDKIITRTSLF